MMSVSPRRLSLVHGSHNSLQKLSHIMLLAVVLPKRSTRHLQLAAAQDSFWHRSVKPFSRQICFQPAYHTVMTTIVSKKSIHKTLWWLIIAGLRSCNTSCLNLQTFARECSEEFNVETSVDSCCSHAPADRFLEERVDGVVEPRQPAASLMLNGNDGHDK